MYNNRKITTDSLHDQYQINLARVMEDSRTTLMIKNIPNKYSLETLLDDFNEYFDNKYDFVNLPVDIKVWILS